MNRRSFLKSAILTAMGTVAANSTPMLHARETAVGLARPEGVAKAGMPYRPFGGTGAMLSPLGLGMLRMPRLPDGSVDEEQSIKMIRYAIDQGMNYMEASYSY